MGQQQVIELRWVNANERLPEKWFKQTYTKVLIIGKHLNVKIDRRPAYGHFFQIGNLIKFEYQGGHDNDGYSGCILEDEFDRVQWLEEVHSSDAQNNTPSKGQMLSLIEWISNYGNDENEDDNIELTSHEWYWGRDRDGDQPIACEDLYDLFISTRPLKSPIPFKTLNLDGESGKRGFFPDQSREYKAEDPDASKSTKDLMMILIDSIKLPINERIKLLNEAIYHISCALHEANTHLQHDTDKQYNER